MGGRGERKGGKGGKLLMLIVSLADPPSHRRRIKTEEKAKVVASVGGGDYSMHCRASCFALNDFNYRMNCTRLT